LIDFRPQLIELAYSQKAADIQYRFTDDFISARIMITIVIAYSRKHDTYDAKQAGQAEKADTYRT